MNIRELKNILSKFDDNLEIKIPNGYEDDEQKYFNDIEKLRNINGTLYLSSLSDTEYNDIKYRHENILKDLYKLQKEFYRIFPDEDCCFIEKYSSYEDTFSYYFYTTNGVYNDEFYNIIDSEIWKKYRFSIIIDDLTNRILIDNINKIRKSVKNISNYHICVDYEYDINKTVICHNYKLDDISKYFDNRIKVRYNDFNKVKINQLNKGE